MRFKSQTLPARRRLVVSVVALAAAFSAGSMTPQQWGWNARAASISSATVAEAAGTSAHLPDFTTIVARNGGAVVNVSVTQKAKNESTMSPFQGMDPNDPFFQFFYHFNGPMPHGGAPVRGMGSGFIVSSDGVILTNAHVVDGASEVTVKLTDKREFNARVIGTDKPSDVAVLKIEARGLPTVTLGSAAGVQVGEWVLAIGSPFGFENSATSGIVSAKSRALPGETYVPFIQTDVAVNPGNSGGPLFNMKGEVVGINSQIYTRSGGYQGLSFAIPIQVALRVKDQLVEHGRVTRGQLGVMIQDVNQALADSFGLKKPAGALVSSVEKASAASKAGIEPGDVILRYNDQDIANSSQLPALVADTEPGSIARLKIMRKGEARRIDVSVGRLRNSSRVASTDVASAEHGRLGVAARALDPDEQKQVDLSGGLIVESASGAAAKAGIQAGDVILALNGTRITSVAQLRQLLAKAGRHVALLVQRDDSKIFVPVDLG